MPEIILPKLENNALAVRLLFELVSFRDVAGAFSCVFSSENPEPVKGLPVAPDPSVFTDKSVSGLLLPPLLFVFTVFPGLLELLNANEGTVN